MPLKVQKYKIRSVKYPDAISAKYNNRKITIADIGDEFYFEFQIADGQDVPRTEHKFIRNKISVTSFKLTKETSELVMYYLSELMGLKIIETDETLH